MDSLSTEHPNKQREVPERVVVYSFVSDIHDLDFSAISGPRSVGSKLLCSKLQTSSTISVHSGGS